MQIECLVMKSEHQAVMLDEAVAGLNINAAGVYVDATYGRGGHARRILQHLGAEGRLLVLDQDPDAIADALQLAAVDPRVIVYRNSFVQLKEICVQQQLIGRVNGILFDLGVSSPQLDQAERGFSFMRDGALDMRMDPDAGIAAAQWLATADVKEIAHVLKYFGEERFSNRIATAIVTARAQQPIATTLQLVNIIKRAIPFTEKHKHPATRTFLALRLFINRELDVLQQVLSQVCDILAPAGRLSVISFHSLEDRIVKQFIAQQSIANHPRLLPIKHVNLIPNMRKIGKAQKPSDAEIAVNPRARSAILRVAEKYEEQ